MVRRNKLCKQTTKTVKTYSKRVQTSVNCVRKHTSVTSPFAEKKKLVQGKQRVGTTTGCPKSTNSARHSLPIFANKSRKKKHRRRERTRFPRPKESSRESKAREKETLQNEITETNTNPEFQILDNISKKLKNVIGELKIFERQYQGCHRRKKSKSRNSNTEIAHKIIREFESRIYLFKTTEQDFYKQFAIKKKLESLQNNLQKEILNLKSCEQNCKCLKELVSLQNCIKQIENDIQQIKINITEMLKYDRKALTELNGDDVKTEDEVHEKLDSAQKQTFSARQFLKSELKFNRKLENKIEQIQISFPNSNSNTLHDQTIKVPDLSYHSVPSNPKRKPRSCRSRRHFDYPLRHRNRRRTCKYSRGNRKHGSNLYDHNSNDCHPSVHNSYQENHFESTIPIINQEKQSNSSVGPDILREHDEQFLSNQKQQIQNQERLQRAHKYLLEQQKQEQQSHLEQPFMVLEDPYEVSKSLVRCSVEYLCEVEASQRHEHIKSQQPIMGLVNNISQTNGPTVNNVALTNKPAAFDNDIPNVVTTCLDHHQSPFMNQQQQAPTFTVQDQYSYTSQEQQLQQEKYQNEQNYHHDPKIFMVQNRNNLNFGREISNMQPVNRKPVALQKQQQQYFLQQSHFDSNQQQPNYSYYQEKTLQNQNLYYQSAPQSSYSQLTCQQQNFHPFPFSNINQTFPHHHQQQFHPNMQQKNQPWANFNNQTVYPGPEFFSQPSENKNSHELNFAEKNNDNHFGISCYQKNNHSSDVQNVINHQKINHKINTPLNVNKNVQHPQINKMTKKLQNGDKKAYNNSRNFHEQKEEQIESNSVYDNRNKNCFSFGCDSDQVYHKNYRLNTESSQNVSHNEKKLKDERISNVKRLHSCEEQLISSLPDNELTPQSSQSSEGQLDFSSLFPSVNSCNEIELNKFNLSANDCTNNPFDWKTFVSGLNKCSKKIQTMVIASNNQMHTTDLCQGIKINQI